MSRKITSANLGDLYSLNSTQVDLILMRVTYDETNTLYFVRSFNDFVYNGQTYTAMPFDVTLPDDTDVNSGTAEINIADVKGEIYGIVRQYDELFIEIEVAHDQDSVAIFPSFRVSAASWDESGVTGTLAREDETIYTFPKNTMDNITFAGLY